MKPSHTRRTFPMRITNDLQEKQTQREILKRRYSDYDPRAHDCFVLDYIEVKERHEREKKAA